MGQHDIIKALQKKPNKWWTTADIAKEIDCNTSSICRSMIKLRQSEMVHYRNLRNGKVGYGYYLYKNK